MALEDEESVTSSIKWWKIFLPIALFCFLLYLPPTAFGINNLSVVEQRVIALFFLAASLWILEPIPIFATSMLVIVLELLMISDKGLFLFMMDEGSEGFGQVLPSAHIMATLASPIIMLFIGGFFLAIAATKYRLDVNLARVMLRPFGTNPKFIMLGLMIITAIFSMFMSNTATTAMMLSILAPVLASFDVSDRARVSYTLSITLAANIGGIGTPIGTPPNAIAYVYISQLMPLSFGEWMLFAVPFVFALIFFSWWMLVLFFPIKKKRIELQIEGTFEKGWKAYVVYGTFVVTILLWVLGDLHGMDSNVVAMIPVAVFLCTNIITKNDLKYISWDVLWLVAGGIALGYASEKTGLASHMVHSIPFETFAPYLVLASAMMLSLVMANFMSHTATANLLLPLMVAFASSLSGLSAVGGAVGLLIGVTFAASLGMCLPISNAPNALAYATGMITTGDMAKTGLALGVFGGLLAVVMLYVSHLCGIF